MIVVPQIQIDAKLIMLTIRMRMEVTQMLAPFLDCVHELNPKKVVMMLAICFLTPYSRINNCVRKKSHNYNNENLIPLLTLVY
jgi:hypothetical protein